MNRRDFLFVSSGAAAGSLAVPGYSAAQGESSPYTGSALVTGGMKPLGYSQIPGFLSETQLGIHHESHYGGAVKAFTGAEAAFEQAYTGGAAMDTAAYHRLKQLQSSRGNSVILHELYFDGMAERGGGEPSGPLLRAINDRFGSVDRWAADFVDSAGAAAGWAVLVVHPANRHLYNVVSDEHAQGPLWLAAPLVVLDTYEHAFYVDYRQRKADYIERFLSFINWDEAEARYARASG